MKPGIIMLLLLTGAFFSCKKKTGNIVIDGQGDGTIYGLFRSDTFSLRTSTVREDSLPANGITFSLIGMMTDPLLGKTSASTYASITLLEPHNDFPNTLEPDSAILFLPIVDGLNFYGDRSAAQLWKICPLISHFSSSTVYYQSIEPQIDEALTTWYSGTVFSAKYDSIKYKSGKLEFHPGLRIKLSTATAKKLMSMPKAAYQSDEGLSSSLEGIAIIPQDNDLPAGKGGIGVFDLARDNSLENRGHIMLYYSDTQAFVFTFSSSSRIVSKGRTGPYPSVVKDQLNNPGQNYPTTYVQSLNGVKTRVELPTVFNLVKDGNVAINKAEIVFTLDKTSISNNFFAPPRLNLFRPSRENGRRNFILPDGAFSSFGGVYDESSNSYTFLITQYIQSLLSEYSMNGKNINYGLFLTVPTAEPVLAGRVAIDHSKTKLIITYTKLK